MADKRQACTCRTGLEPGLQFSADLYHKPLFNCLEAHSELGRQLELPDPLDPLEFHVKEGHRLCF